MSPISSIAADSAANSTFALGAPTTAARVPQKQLGREDFMKLLAVQFQMQDPMKPMEDTAFIAQTAQFTSLEQTTTMANELTQLRADQQRVVATSYLGHNVTLDAGSGNTISGNVTAIDTSASNPRIVVDGKTYSLSAVLRVEPGIVSAPAPQATGA
jgi:flagellar basal-body rod modification protein FlgD